MRGDGGCAWDCAADVSRVWGQGGAEPGPGVFRALDAVLEVWGGGQDHREAVLRCCGGNGRVRRSRQVKVRIPAGAKDGMKVRIPGRGSAGRRGGPAGDLYVVTRVEEHPVFKRRGDDFVVEVPVSFVEAALGAEIEVPRPGGGTVRLRLPAGTQDGKQFKVRGAGAPRARTHGGEKGDLIVRVGVVVPKKLKRREREILEALAEERDEDVREELFKKVGLVSLRKRPVYMIGIASELIGVHPQTLRMYEQKGLLRPRKSIKNTRLYSQEDVDLGRYIQRLTQEMGMNLAGVSKVLDLERQVARLEAENRLCAKSWTRKELEHAG